MQKCGKILRGRKDALAPVVSTLRWRAPPPFRRLCDSDFHTRTLARPKAPIQNCGRAADVGHIVYAAASCSSAGQASTCSKLSATAE